MIIELILTAIFTIFEFLTTPINIPTMPPEVEYPIEEVLTYLSTGAGILSNYIDLGMVAVLFGVVLVIDIGIGLYHFVMWVIRKIPMLSMS